MNAVVFGGHLSPFGRAFIQEVVKDEFFRPTLLLLADAERWLLFRRRLLRTKKLPGENAFRNKYRQATTRFLNSIKTTRPELKVAIIHDVNSDETRSLTESKTLGLTAAFPQLFSEELLARFSDGCVNVHPSYLPRCRGAHPIYWTIASREPFGGVSSHFMTREIDAGAIIARCKIEFDPDTIEYSELYHLAIGAIPGVLRSTVDYFKAGASTAIVQSEEEATFFREDTDWHHRIYWEKETREEIDAKIRAGKAFSMKLTGLKIRLTPPVSFRGDVDWISNAFADRLVNGLVVRQTGEWITVRCSEGYLKMKFRVEHPNRMIHYFLRFSQRFLGTSFLREQDRLV